MDLDSLMKRMALLHKSFDKIFGGRAEVSVMAPGRVVLLGGHTDYNRGCVLSLAIDLNTILITRRRADTQVVLHSLNTRKTTRFFLSELRPGSSPLWEKTLQGGAWALQKAGYALKGIEGVFHGTLPLDAGLGASTTMAVALAWAWNVQDDLGISRPELARLCWNAESQFVGSPVSEVDAFTATLGRDRQLLCVDCRAESVSYWPLPPTARVVVCDTGVRRTQVQTISLLRRRECESATGKLQGHVPSIHSLRDVTPQDLIHYRQFLPSDLYRRVLHVVTEHQRVLQATQALVAGDLDALGRLMNTSHRSLRDDYEISSPELDAMWLAANEVPGCYGACMTGTGLGGNVVALVNRRALRRFEAHVVERYRELTGKEATVRPVRAADGVMTL